MKLNSILSNFFSQQRINELRKTLQECLNPYI